jgi:hypothetical protein
VNHGLLVAGKEIGEVGILLQRLTNASHVTMAENAEAAGEEGCLRAITLYMLILEEQDRGLSRR